MSNNAFFLAFKRIFLSRLIFYGFYPKLRRKAKITEFYPKLRRKATISEFPLKTNGILNPSNAVKLKPSFNAHNT